MRIFQHFHLVQGHQATIEHLFQPGQESLQTLRRINHLYH